MQAQVGALGGAHHDDHPLAAGRAHADHGEREWRDLFDPAVLLADLVDTLAVTFSIALRLGSPFIGFAIIANMLVGALNKLAVQIPIYFVALPAMLLGALAMLYFNLPFILSVFGGNFAALYTGN